MSGNARPDTASENRSDPPPVTTVPLLDDPRIHKGLVPALDPPGFPCPRGGSEFGSPGKPAARRDAPAALSGSFLGQSTARLSLGPIARSDAPATSSWS